MEKCQFSIEEGSAIRQSNDNHTYNSISESDEQESELGNFGLTQSEQCSNIFNKAGTSEVNIELSVKRWAILFIYCLVTASNAAMWITFSSISESMIRYYGIDIYAVNWLSMASMLSYTFLAIPASLLLAKFGLRPCMIIAASLDGAGACLRYAGVNRNHFPVVAVGQCFTAVAFAFILQSAPKLAAVWFGKKERATATSIGISLNLFGVAFGFIQSTNLVREEYSIKELEQGMSILLCSQAVFCVGVVLLVYIFVDEKPRLPPSYSQASRDFYLDSYRSFASPLKNLFRNKDFNLVSQAFGINFGMIIVVPVVLDQTIKSNASKYISISEFWVGMMGFVATTIGSFSIFLVGPFIDKFHWYKGVAILLFIMNTVFMGTFTYVLNYMVNFKLLFAVYCVLNFFLLPYASSGLEQIAEITYPVEEDLSSSVALVFGNFYGFVFIFVFGAMINNGFILITYVVMTMLFFLGLLLSIAARVPLVRSSVDETSNNN